jgi:hypothetical protein
MPPAVQHLLHLLEASWSSLVASMGTTTLAVFVLGVLPFLGSLVFRFYRHGFEEVKAHFAQTLAGGALWALATWFVLYGWNVAKTVYRDHQTMMNELTSYRERAAATPLPTPSLSPSLFMECHMISLPITIPAHAAIHLIGANQKFVKSEHWGFYDISNDSDKNEPWPDPKLIRDRTSKLSKTEKLNSGTNGYLCNVGNLGPDDAVLLRVSLDLNFGNDKHAIRFEPIISPLAAHSTFPFFILNDCPTFASLIWRDVAQVETLEEPQLHEVKLRREYRNPIDQIMVLFPSDIQWIGQQPCK